MALPGRSVGSPSDAELLVRMEIEEVGVPVEHDGAGEREERSLPHTCSRADRVRPGTGLDLQPEVAWEGEVGLERADRNFEERHIDRPEPVRGMLRVPDRRPRAARVASGFFPAGNPDPLARGRDW